MNKCYTTTLCVIQAKEDLANIDLNDHLKCPVCTELCKRPRECNECGRFFCSACIARLTSCPLCLKEPFLSHASRFAARSLDSVRVLCAHCETPVVRSRYEKHLKTCTARARSCFFRDCEFVAFNKEEMLEHVDKAHGDELWEYADHLFKIIVPGMFDSKSRFYKLISYLYLLSSFLYALSSYAKQVEYRFSLIMDTALLCSRLARRFSLQ